MENSPEIEKAGLRWFFGAGIIALGFSIFLACVDFRLSTSNREQQRTKMLREIREAQTSLDSRVTDDRQVWSEGQSQNDSAQTDAPAANEHS